MYIVYQQEKNGVKEVRVARTDGKIDKVVEEQKIPYGYPVCQLEPTPRPLPNRAARRKDGRY